jgi:DNA-binding protein YbaB
MTKQMQDAVQERSIRKHVVDTAVEVKIKQLREYRRVECKEQVVKVYT